MARWIQHPAARAGAALAWALLIFVQSASARTPDLVPEPFRHFDKLGHVLMYAVLALLVCRAGPPGRRGWPLAAFAIAAAYGVSDEWHQHFVPGRSASVLDWLADALGAALGAGLWQLRLRARIHSRKS